MLRPGTYLINEDSLREKFLGFEVGLCDSQWPLLEQEIAQSKRQSVQAFSNFSSKLLIIPALIIVASVILYFNFSKIFKSQQASNTENVSLPIQNTVQTQPKPNPPVVNSIAVYNQKAKTDSIAKAKELEEKLKKEKADEEARIASEKAKAALNDSLAVLRDTSNVSHDTPKKKKKKRKKRKSFESIENLRSGAFESSNNGDDVVVPN